jgi:hypothetical protein
VRRRCPRGERAEIMKLILSEILNRGAGTRRATALRGRGRAVLLGKLVRLLLGVEHHLLISPLCELSVGIKVRARRGDLTLLGRVDWVCLLVGILIKSGGVEWLCVCIPTGLLLLDRVWIMGGLRRRNLGGYRRGISRRRDALTGY